MTMTGDAAEEFVEIVVVVNGEWRGGAGCRWLLKGPLPGGLQECIKLNSYSICTGKKLCGGSFSMLFTKYFETFLSYRSLIVVYRLIDKNNYEVFTKTSLNPIKY